MPFVGVILPETLATAMACGGIRKDKLVKIREYFDLQTATESGTPHKLYS